MVRIVNGNIVPSDESSGEYEADEPLMGGGGRTFSSIGSSVSNIFKEIFTLEMNLCGIGGIKFWMIAALSIVVSLLLGGPWTVLFNCVFLVFLFVCLKFQNSAMERMRESQQPQQQQAQNPQDPRTTVNSNNTMLQNPNNNNPQGGTGINRGGGGGRGNVFTLSDLNTQPDNQNNQ